MKIPNLFICQKCGLSYEKNVGVCPDCGLETYVKRTKLKGKDHSIRIQVQNHIHETKRAGIVSRNSAASSNRIKSSKRKIIY